MATDGFVRQTGRQYKNGLESWEIHVNKSHAKNLPYKEGNGLETLLIVGDAKYRGFIRATLDSKIVWVSPTLYTESGERTTLAQALVEAGFKRNQRVRIFSHGEQINITHVEESQSLDPYEKITEWTHMPERHFGEIPGFPEGSTFSSRRELSQAGVHTPTQAGIAGSQFEGADSIVLSGGYEDDSDDGNVIIYTGQGGRDLVSGRQTSHQMLVRGNKALAVSRKFGFPIRVIRGSSHVSTFSPREGYRYDGLYQVEDHWKERGRSGFDVWRFRLTKIPTQVTTPPVSQAAAQSTTGNPRRVDTRVSRVIRDTRQTRRIKELYDYHCQICNVRLEGNAGPYAEAAHIKPLGRPHNGPDILENLLCLCPNHHVLFDYGGIAITDDFLVIGEESQLRVEPKHKIGLEFIRYHREHYGFDASAS